MDHISAIFETREDAENALARLGEAGIRENQISMITTETTAGRAFKIENNTKADEGATTGAALGGLAGAVIAAMASAGAVAIPGLNLVVSGYLVSALAGFGLGAAGGGIIGALLGLGFQENEAKIYEDELNNGGILIAVKPNNADQRSKASRILDLAKNPDKLAQGAPRAADSRTDTRI